MTHHVTERAEAFWLGELSREERSAVDAHLAACAACRTAYDDIGVAIAALRTRPVDHATAHLEARVVGALRRRRELPGRDVAAMLAAAVVCIVMGFAAGRSTATSSTRVAAADTSFHEFLMLLEEPTWPPASPLARPGYREWARSLATMHRFVGAEKLTEEPGFRVLPTGDVTPATRVAGTNYSGWYLVLARDYNDAIALARQGPHLSYGSILVRQVE